MKHELPRRILAFGVYAGLIQVLSGIIMYYSGIYFESWSILISLAVLIVFIYTAINYYSSNSGVSRFWKLVLPGSIVGFLCGVIYSFYNLISITFIYTDFIEEARTALLLKRSVGLTGAEIEALTNDLQSSLTTGSIAFSNLILLTLIGFASSLLISIFFTRRRHGIIK